MRDIIEELRKAEYVMLKDGWQSRDLAARAGLVILALRGELAKLQRTPANSVRPRERPELEDLLKAAKAKVDAMSEAELQEMINEQGASYARSIKRAVSTESAQ